MKKKPLMGRAALTVLAGVFALLFLLPTILTLTNSFMTESEISANYGVVFDSASRNGSTYMSEKVNLKFIPDMVSLSQYTSAFIKTPDYLLRFWNSFILVVPIVILQVAVATMAAYSFTRYQGKFKSFLFFFYVILMLMPYQVTLVPNYLVSDWLGILGSRWSIIFPGAFAPFSVFLLTKFMRRVPVALMEAARLDGAGEWQIFTRIYIPQCRGAIYSIVILVFIDYWNMVEQPLILLADETKQPLSVYLASISPGEIGIAFALAAVYMIPSLLLFLHGEEALVEGIAHSGSVKG